MTGNYLHSEFTESSFTILDKASWTSQIEEISIAGNMYIK